MVKETFQNPTAVVKISAISGLLLLKISVE